MTEDFARNRITQLRLQKGGSEYQMSYDLGHSRGYIYNISSGKSLPPLSELFAICDYFGITLAEFFDAMFTVLTREAVAPVSSIHDRMPFILGKDSLWIRPDDDPRKIAKMALTKMVMKKATDHPEPKPAFMQI